MFTDNASKASTPIENNFQYLLHNFFFCGGHPVMFIKLKDNKTVSGFIQTQQYIFFLSR